MSRKCPIRSAMEGCPDSGPFSGRFEAHRQPGPLNGTVDGYGSSPGPIPASAESAVVRYTPLADVAVSQSASPLLLYRAADAADGSGGAVNEREKATQSEASEGIGFGREVSR